MLKNKETYPEKVFVSLQDLLKMEHLSRGFSFLAKKQKVKSILGGKHASKLRGRGLDFEEVRNYVAGDDIRNIDWKVTARTQKTHSRVFSEEKEKPALIIVDQSKSMFFGSQNKTKSVVAAELAALVAYRIQKEGDRVGGVVFADNSVDIVFPKRNKQNILRFLEKIVQRNNELHELEPKRYDDTLKEMLKKIQNIVTHDFLIIIISDFQLYSPDIIKFIPRLSLHNDVILAKIYDPLEQKIPKTKFIASNGKKQISVNGNNKNLKTKFESSFNNDFGAFKNQMRKHKIPALLFNTIDDIDLQLKEIMMGGKK